MKFFIIMIIFVFIGGSCSLAGTWWSKKKKRKIKNKEYELEFILLAHVTYNKQD